MKTNLSSALRSRAAHAPSLLRSTLYALTLYGLSAHSTLAQTWQTVDTYQYVPGLSSGNYGLTVAPSGVVWACGWGDDGTNGDHGLVLASADGGNTWSAPLDDFTVLNASVEDANGMTSDAAGNLYVAGYYYFDTGPAQQFVRRSADGGATWSIVDNLAQDIGAVTAAKPQGLTTDSAGNVYFAAGKITFNSSGAASYYWVMRKGTGGTNFATVDSFTTGGSTAQAVFAHPTAGVFAVGNANIAVKSGSTTAWLVRRSLDGGASWSNVDTFQYSSGIPSYAQGIGADAHGNLYVVGYANVTTKKGSTYQTTHHWLVRKSSNGGASWSTVEDFAGGQPGAFAADSNGNLFVAGIASTAWTVRESLAGSGTWQTVDTFNGGAASLAANAQGYVFVGGYGADSTGVDHWLVRKH